MLWEYKDRGKKGYDLTERFFDLIRTRFAGLEIDGPERAGQDILMKEVFSNYPNPTRPVDFVIRESDEVLATKPADISLLWQTRPTTNRLYFGDNLHVLANLLTDDDIRGKVRLIYIDPPYATKSVFQSRSQKDAYTDLLEGSQYIEFMRERLILLRELLAPDGSIYIHLE